MPDPDILFFIAALFAEIVGTMAGFGSSTIFLPVALLFFDFRTALILVAIFHMSGNIGRITFFRHGFNKGMLLRFGVPSVIFTIIGALLVDYVPQHFLKVILGLFLIIYVVLSISQPGLAVQPTGRNTLFGGSISGFFAGLIGTGGALIILFRYFFLWKLRVHSSGKGLYQRCHWKSSGYSCLFVSGW
ncbi:MAG: sulfite exporter TauE/SafE family protein [Methanolobus sp.]|uniref:sulfite exporter TauE/SafE family protein n=1 Tax=Methanolobus sp. TaxID=1874737 RepID=UPI002731D5ED|nr:sulfite exporter TauE/SafE family protein [Methanolobus sp.]MDP2215703.1 sulfite exporter TauE/SafE family protein [Methanolobus sp.]